jgi:hypothetical protein
VGLAATRDGGGAAGVVLETARRATTVLTGIGPPSPVGRAGLGVLDGAVTGRVFRREVTGIAGCDTGEPDRFRWSATGFPDPSDGWVNAGALGAIPIRSKPRLWSGWVGVWPARRTGSLR